LSLPGRGVNADGSYDRSIDSHPTDLAALAVSFGRLLHAAGVPVTPDRSGRFASAVVLAEPASVTDLYWCARVTMLSRRADIDVFDRVFAQVFGGVVDVADHRGDPSSPPAHTRSEPTPPRPTEPRGAPPRAGAGTPSASAGGGEGDTERDAVVAIASAEERLARTDFAALGDSELAALRDLMRRLRVTPPTRVGRRAERHASGARLDMRATLRRSHRTGGDPLDQIRTRPAARPRRVVVLCDISGSMQPYARAYVQFLHAARGAARAEVFTFATRLTRLTRALSVVDPGVALARAAATAPDWHGGTRIGDAVKAFLDGYGRRGLARGAVVVIVSDGWETGDPAVLGEQMARLSRLAHRVVWVNPRTADARYQPLAGGMAAALPYCDAMVSGHSAEALARVVAEIARA
jgi:uncharacterized protein with von Willebrand factor type A (vWA) domain